jgi:bifunctional non-homologous end joining protein LigD
MLSRPGPLPSGPGWSFELKWDGFRAIASTVDGFRIRSRSGWDMTEVLPEMRALPKGLVLDGELVAWKGSEPHFPFVCRRVLNRDTSIPLTFVIFDVLRRGRSDATSKPYSERRAMLEGLELNGPGWTTSETFDDGLALYTAVCNLGLEGVVAKKLSSTYGSGEREVMPRAKPSS